MNIPSKEHLNVNLSNSADRLLLAIVSICLVSDTPVVFISSQSGTIANSWTLAIQSVSTNHSQEAANLFGDPLKELELFAFVIPLSKNTYHVTPLAFKRVEYLNASKLQRFWMRTTSIQALLAALIGILTLVFTALVAIVNLLNSLRSLLQ